MASDQDKAVARRVFEEIWNKGQVALVDQLFTPDFIAHDPSNPSLRSRRDIETLVTMYRSAFSDLRFTVDGQVADQNVVVTWWSSRGTNTGPLMNVSPTNRQATVTGMTMDRFVGGKIAESRINWDALGLFQQLGIVPALNQSPPLDTGMPSPSARTTEGLG